jgi:sugar lactone lactonase YvrE
MWIDRETRRGEAQLCFALTAKTIAPFACGVILFFVTACQPQFIPTSTPTIIAPAPVRATPSPAAAPSKTPPEPALTPIIILSPPAPTSPASVSVPRQNITEIATGLGSPDDLALLPDGSILFSDESNGTVGRVVPGGPVTTLVRGLEAPEGIVPLPDGSLLIAEQRRNRIVGFQPGHAVTTWFALQNSRGGLGVDGIARDPKSGDIIIPDSPNGRVLRVDANGKNERVLASGFARPTGADVAPDGTILVADETGDQVYRVQADGRKESLGHFALPDDVVADAEGNVFVASLADNSIREVDARTHTARLIATVQGPQGIVVAADGSLIVSEPARHRLLHIRP